MGSISKLSFGSMTASTWNLKESLVPYGNVNLTVAFDRTAQLLRAPTLGELAGIMASMLSLGTAFAAFVFFSECQFSKRCTTPKDAGTNSTARQVEASLPDSAISRIRPIST